MDIVLSEALVESETKSLKEALRGLAQFLESIEPGTATAQAEATTQQAEDVGILSF